ncbi:MAG TPA: ribonuclease HI family protein [Myxococcales bacterium]
MIVTPAQLLLAIAEHESLERTCAALGIDRETAAKLLRGAAAALRTEKPPSKPASPVKSRQPGSNLGRRAGDGSEGLRASQALRVFSDGAARGNPGPAGAGAVITDAKGNVVARLGHYLGRQTNNVAEYQGLLLGLRHAIELGAREVEVRADSQLMIRQLKGEYAVRNTALKPLHAEALRLLRGFTRYDLQHVPREENALADEMSNRAIDEEM